MRKRDSVPDSDADEKRRCLRPYLPDEVSPQQYSSLFRRSAMSVSDKEADENGLRGLILELYLSMSSLFTGETPSVVDRRASVKSRYLKKNTERRGEGLPAAWMGDDVR